MLDGTLSGLTFLLMALIFIIVFVSLVVIALKLSHLPICEYLICLLILTPVALMMYLGYIQDSLFKHTIENYVTTSVINNTDHSFEYKGTLDELVSEYNIDLKVNLFRKPIVKTPIVVRDIESNSGITDWGELRTINTKWLTCRIYVMHKQKE